jgi:hypothetical protein
MFTSSHHFDQLPKKLYMHGLWWFSKCNLTFQNKSKFRMCYHKEEDTVSSKGNSTRD